jgi:thiol-disulfide isomerase/thioredoxin
MKKNISLLIILFIFLKISFASTNNFNNSIPIADTIVGYFNFDQLQESPYSDWFIPEHSSYEVDKETLDSLETNDLANISIIIVIGTWCKDSQRETPRFVKIMEYLNFQNITAIGVNRQKKADDTDVPELNIQYVPTIIFYKNNTEIGRIVEAPDETLEKDLVKIIKAN